ncbi:alpha-ketoglutarate-dependent dioxygenase [Acrasis kona]|uniref:Alpha-ketoglutarate-dependent dioxygenase n=1 Tax=Acrasis kona TaxID=1008807 RepID=A0AAW2YQG7_9EUKA
MKRKQQDILSFFKSTNGTAQIIKKQKKNEPEVQYKPKWMQSVKVVNDSIPLIFDKIHWHRVSYYKPSFEKSLSNPRFTTVYGCDEDLKSETKRKYPIEPIPDFLLPVLKEVEKVTNQHYNMIMCNLYLEPGHSITWHSDDENFLGPNPCIASLTLGGTRDFFLREKADHQNKIKWELAHGDLIVMKGATQHDWEHAVPKRTQANEPRINLTFRKVIDYRGTNNYYKYTKFGDDDPSTSVRYLYNRKRRAVVIADEQQETKKE